MRKFGVWGVRPAFSVVAACVAAAVALAAMTNSAEARKRHHYAKKHYVKRAPAYAPPFAALVVDANSGRTLYAKNENEPRHPASVTKVMTLYLLFEQLEKGRFRLDSPLTISAHAARQPPSKLGLPPGETIEVEDAIKALVTRSANDIAVAVAENVGGDEPTFAEMMTRKARSLGMTRTLYRNASGLPNPEQVTTARDLAILGRAIQERFPRYYKYFSTRTFYFAGASIRNHNRLLGRIDGVDGIKTGYTRSSGFNLLTSVRRDGRHIISVVLGGPSARIRDNIMTNLVVANLERGSTSRTATMLAEAPGAGEAARPAAAFDIATRTYETPPARPIQTAARDHVGAPVQLAANPPTPMAVAAVAAATARSNHLVERPRAAVVAADPRGVAEDRTAALAPAHRPPANVRIVAATTPVAAAVTTPGALKWVTGAGLSHPRDEAKSVPAPTPVPRAQAVAAAKPDARKPARHEAEAKPARAETRIARAKAESEAKAEARAETTRPALAKSGWMIQIGAAENVGKANDLLTRARAQGRAALASARPFTEKVQKGDSTLYRARFAGLDGDEAEAACRALKRGGFACFTTRN